MILARQIIRTNRPKYTLNGDLNLVREFLIFVFLDAVLGIILTCAEILMLVLGKISVVGGW